METALVALAAIITAIAVIIAIPLAILATGIRRQHHAGSLAAQPHGFSAALTSRVLDLHTARTPNTSQRRPARQLTATSSGQEARQS